MKRLCLTRKIGDEIRLHRINPNLYRKSAR